MANNGMIIGQVDNVTFYMEEGILNKREAIDFLGNGIGESQFDKQYKVCAEKQGGQKTTYRKSKLYERYLQLCESPKTLE